MKRAITLLCAALLAAAAWAGSPDPLNLATNTVYAVSRRTPVMPEFAPADPVAASARVRYIPQGGVFAVALSRPKGAAVWYQVAAADTPTNRPFSGWVNSTALIGQRLAVAATAERVPQ